MSTQIEQPRHRGTGATQTEILPGVSTPKALFLLAAGLGVFLLLQLFRLVFPQTPRRAAIQETPRTDGTES